MICPADFRAFSIVEDDSSLGIVRSDGDDRFSEEQLVKILREATRAPVSEVAKRHSVSEVMIYVLAQDEVSAKE